ncbi:hypothetical protein BC834DRAFT_969622 [Gloeopeniophorella convolvens]|nr:hypothetical protein BC834DRAFT_969622 [Gloeopeniophorella convolvens]
MQRSKDADHLAVHSDATYPAGPDNHGELFYFHVAPLGPASIAIIVASCLAIAAFFGCYIHPLIKRRLQARAGARAPRKPVLASARAMLGLRPPSPPTTPQLLARRGLPDMRIIARPPPALRLFRAASQSSSLSPTATLPAYSPPADTKVVVAPVSIGVGGQGVASRTTPKKGDKAEEEQDHASPASDETAKRDN